MSNAPLLQVDGLTVALKDGTAIVEDVSLSLEAGRTLGIVGESGCGKTTLALALLGYTIGAARITMGRVSVRGSELVGRSETQIRPLRGSVVSYVPQDPASWLNPSLRLGDQISEVIRAHFADQDADAQVAPAIRRVHLPSDPEFLRRYPHQLSGGQQQRVAIALALSCQPPLVVLDEPTTGLDVITQAMILDEIGRLQREIGLALIFVSHDLGVIASVADRVAVMYAGRIVEEGPLEAVAGKPKHPYARGLMASVPDHRVRRRLRGIPGVALAIGEHPPGCSFAPRCGQRVPECEQELPALVNVGDDHRVRCREWQRTPAPVYELPPVEHVVPEKRTELLTVDQLRAIHSSRTDPVVAVDNVSFQVGMGECVALVGESGSGKTTIARAIVGLHPPAAGQVLLEGNPLASLAKHRARAERRRIQIIFQNPNESLNPRQPVRDIIARPAQLLRGMGRRSAQLEAAALLERVRLPGRLAGRYPRELSGGERQRVAIARALAAEPDLIICDEITSSLDVSVQAAVLDLLAELRAQLDLALLFISHDLGVVAAVSERVLVLDHGSICEEGETTRVLTAPTSQYTRQLVDAIRTLEPILATRSQR